MNGVHDLGGMHGFGRVEREEREPTFHAPWERTVLAIQRAVTRGGVCSIDEFRHAIERMEPAAYLASGYYERWLDGLCRLLVDKGVLASADLDALTSAFLERPDAPATAGPLNPREGDGPASLTTREPSFRRTPERRPRFVVGDRVVTSADHPRGHTRLPRYARGKRGVVVAHYGTQVFPDTNAHGLGERPEPLYCVRFDASELWGRGAEPNEAVHLDLWEPYLLPG